MISGAEKWKDLFQSQDILPESSVRMFADIGDVDFEPIVYTNGEAVGSEVNNTIGKDITQGLANEAPEYATLEHNYWLLDGSFDYVDNVVSDYPNNIRYVSKQLSNENGNFSDKPQITYQLSNVKTMINAVTILFSERNKECATSLNVNKVGWGRIESVNCNPGYNVITISNNGNYDNYNEIEIQINSWSMPYRRARYTQFWDNVRIHIDRQDISKFKLTKSSDILSGAMPQNTIDVEIFDIENNYDMDVGIYRSILNNSKWRVEVAYKVDNAFQWINLGYYYLNQVVRPKNGLTARFVLNDVVKKIAGKFPAEIQGAQTDPYYWNTWRELIGKIATLTNTKINILGGYDLDDTAAGYPTQRTFRTQLDLSEWLQTVANASKTVITSNNNDEININTLINSNNTFANTNAIDTLTLYNAYEYPEIEKLAQLKETSITGYQKTSNDTAVFTYSKSFGNFGEVQTAKNERIHFDEDTTSQIYTFPPSYADSYNTWIYMFISNARRLTGNCRINPGLELFDLLEVETKSGEIVKGYLTLLELEYTGSFKGKYTVYAPQGQN